MPSSPVLLHICCPHPLSGCICTALVSLLFGTVISTSCLFHWFRDKALKYAFISQDNYTTIEYRVLFSALCPMLVCFHCPALILASVTSSVGLVKQSAWYYSVKPKFLTLVGKSCAPDCSNSLTTSSWPFWLATRRAVAPSCRRE